jgi:hypothetical protein
MASRPKGTGTGEKTPAVHAGVFHWALGFGFLLGFGFGFGSVNLSAWRYFQHEA